MPPPLTTTPPSGAVLLYDGSCGLCARSVQFILRHERNRTLRFAPLEGALGSELRQRHPDIAHVDSMIWIDDPMGDRERVFVRGEAVLRVAGYLGGLWNVARLGRLLPAAWRNAAYDLVARHRRAVVSGDDVCLVPSADERGRFLP